jgi:Transposase C of IS166 homeodomain
MDKARDALPDDITTLKEALASERAKALDIAAELAVARAKASEDSALIAQQKLRIAKLERQVYGQRSERSSRLIDQLALTFEELEASATEDELAAERAVARTTTVRGFTRTRSSPRSVRATSCSLALFKRWINSRGAVLWLASADVAPSSCLGKVGAVCAREVSRFAARPCRRRWRGCSCSAGYGASCRSIGV